MISKSSFSLFIRRGSMLAAFAALLPLAGCATLFGGGKDPASGEWKGNWYVGNATKPAGGLDCTITKVPKSDEWNASFDAEFGGRAVYQVDLKGARKDDKIVFGGEVDLGEASGGVFNWTGEIIGDEFNGKYTSKAISGTFKMLRAGAAPAAAAPAEKQPETKSDAAEPKL